MKREKFFLLLILVGATLPFELFSQENKETKNFPINYEGSYVLEVVNNMTGGIKTGSSIIGMGNIKLFAQTEELNFWENGEFLINIVGTHGKNPTENLVGDFQGVSNIASESNIYLYELWYKHTVGDFSITAGLQDMGIDFVGSESSALFFNGSFGIHSTIASNVNSPIFPLTALGAQVKWNINDDISIKTALFDGLADGFDKNPYNLKWDFNRNDGLFSISEAEFTNVFFENFSNSIKIGYYYHNHFEDNNDEQVRYYPKYGFYVVADQTLSNTGSEKKSSFFVQTGFCPSKKNDNDLYLGAGFNFYNLLGVKHSDVLGIAIAFANFKNQKKSETTFEFTYLIYLTENIYAQPDLQYIINPMGTSEKLKNAFVGSLRLGLNF